MAIAEKTRKIIWARSGNRCSICKTELVLQKDEFNRHLNIGEECHIISRQPQGPRHQSLKDFDYDDSTNLLLLCCNHHKTVDERVEGYPVDTLQKIKAEHESWVKNNLETDIVVGRFEPKESNKLTELISYVTSKHDIEMNIKSSRQIMDSEDGLQLVFEEAEKVKKRIYETADALAKQAAEYKIILKDNGTRICNIRFKGHTFLAQLNQAYINSANGSYLLFAVVHGLYDDNGSADIFHPCTVLEIIRLDFGFNEKGEFGWRDQENDKTFYTTIEITDIWTTKFFKTVLK